MDARLRKALLSHFAISADQLNDVERIFEEDKPNFIPRMIEEGYVRSTEFFRALANEMGWKYYDRSSLIQRKDLAKLLPYSYLKRHGVFPVEQTDDRIVLATSNPFDNRPIQEIQAILGGRYKVEIAISDPSAISESLNEAYREIHKLQAIGELYYRSPEESAYKVLSSWQRKFILILALALAVWFVVDYPSSLIVIFSTLNILYFCVNPVKFYISLRGFMGSRRLLHISRRQFEALRDEDLPVYTILIPLFREAKVLPKLLQNIMKLDYPKERLDVKLILEEDDEETLGEVKRLGLLGGQVGSGSEKGRAGKLGCEVVLVPKADIRTKPRACNFALKRALGDLCVIYDAEDNPDPDQLKKVVMAFSRPMFCDHCGQRLPKDARTCDRCGRATERALGLEYVCLQCRLNFYNPGQNILTRWFALEYSYWFDYYLSGLDWVGGPIPLGGTSNHFRTEALKEIGGWDPYNVTEDADIGIRIARRKLRTAIVNSYTFEEANSKLWSWIKQRSRWHKGYAQTYLVHMRHPKKLLEELGIKSFLVFQLTFGGNIFLPLVNPVLWAVTILSFLSPGAFQFLFFPMISFMCMINLLIGNVVYILLHLGPAILTRNKSAIPFGILVPFYWVLISVGAWRGTIQLLTKPFYWEKTTHGLYQLG